MVLRSVSILATVVLTAAAAALVVRGALFGAGPISIALQLLGLAQFSLRRQSYARRAHH